MWFNFAQKDISSNEIFDEVMSILRNRLVETGFISLKEAEIWSYSYLKKSNAMLRRIIEKETKRMQYFKSHYEDLEINKLMGKEEENLDRILEELIKSFNICKTRKVISELIINSRERYDIPDEPTPASKPDISYEDLDDSLNLF